jgi:hypothetical protein
MSLGKIIENTEISVKEILFNYKHKSWLMIIQKYFIKGNGLNCSGYRIQNKWMDTM